MEIIFNKRDAERILASLEHEYTLHKSERLLQLMISIRDQLGWKHVHVLFPTENEDIDFLIMMVLDDHNLGSICKINRYTANLCRNKTFWLGRIQNVYGVNLVPYTNKGLTAKTIYTQLRAISDQEKLEYAIKKSLLPLANKYINQNPLLLLNMNNPLKIAVETGDVNMVKLIVDAYDSEDTYISRPDPYEFTKWFIDSVKAAISNGRADILDIILKIQEYANRITDPDDINYILANMWSLSLNNNEWHNLMEVIGYKLSYYGGFFRVYEGDYPLPKSMEENMSSGDVTHAREIRKEYIEANREKYR